MTPPKKMNTGEIGSAIYPTRIIKIDNTLSGELLTLTILHELRHAYQFETGLMQILGPQARELDADGFASFLTSIFHLSFK